MRFESPWLLLAVIPAALAVWWGLRRLRRRPDALRFPGADRLRAAGLSRAGRLADLPLWLQAGGVALAVLALARPQVEDAGQMTGEGSDFVVALDMSGSMNAVDLPPEKIREYHERGREPPSRFESARETLSRFVASRDGDRIGLVVFASKAYVKFPLTLDKDAMLRILDGLVLDDRVRGPTGECTNGCTIPGESTAIGDALARAFKRVEGSSTKTRSIVLITDGDNNAGKAAPEEVARFIGEQSPDRPVRVYTFLVGTGKDTFMPAMNAFSGRPLVTPDGLRVYERPEEPFPVNPSLLRDIATQTGGKAFEAPTEEDFRREFRNLETTEFAAPALHRWREAYLGPLVAALVLLLAGEALSATLLRRWP